MRGSEEFLWLLEVLASFPATFVKVLFVLLWSHIGAKGVDRKQKA